MKQALYLQGATAISPQHSFGPGPYLHPLMQSDTGKLYVLDADYRKYITPVAIRRMSRLMKMAISAAMQCLEDAGVATPDAIITGTGRGSMTDMEGFLEDMIRLEEGALNPTLFIQSTYNSPNGWIALQTQSTGYNQTYVHRGCSLELALLDAQLILAESDRPQQLLAGCYDEMTDDYFIIKQKIGYWKEPVPHSQELLQKAQTPGTIGGEGVAFFTCSNLPGNAATVIQDIRLLQHTDPASLRLEVSAMLERSGLEPADLDVLLTGRNGDSRHEGLYTELDSLFGNHTSVAAFKHLCGEYDTASGFGIWMADQIIRTQELPEIVLQQLGSHQEIRSVLLVNHYQSGSASVFLMQRV